MVREGLRGTVGSPFIGANVLPLQMEFIATDPSGVSYLNSGKYSVTEKADGDRSLLMVSF